MITEKGLIHSVEPFGAFDGPGLRWVVFMQGCLLRCKYCHNPDTWQRRSNNAHEMTVEQMLKSINRYKPYYKNSSGGVTASGGEPLLQAKFVSAFFQSVKSELGLTTCLDTSGISDCTSKEIIDLLRSTDTILLDIKGATPELTKNLTGQHIMPIGLLTMAQELGVPIVLRHVLVPGITDSSEHLEKIAFLMREYSVISNVEVLPYHTKGQYKWERLGLPYRLQGVREATTDDVTRATEIIRGG